MRNEYCPHQCLLKNYYSYCTLDRCINTEYMKDMNNREYPYTNPLYDKQYQVAQGIVKNANSK